MAGLVVERKTGVGGREVCERVCVSLSAACAEQGEGDLAPSFPSWGLAGDRSDQAGGGERVGAGSWLVVRGSGSWSAFLSPVCAEDQLTTTTQIFLLLP